MGDETQMSFSGLLGLLTRQWYAVTVGLLVTLALGLLVAGGVPSRYETTASIVLLPPPSAVGPGGNPYLAMGGLDAAADVTAASLSSQELQEQVRDAGATSTVVRDGGAVAPILLVTVEARSAGAATNALDLLVDALPTALLDIQSAAGVAQGALLQSELIASSARPAVSRSPQLRMLLVVWGLGLGATLLLGAAIDRATRRRRATSDADRPPASAAGVTRPPSTSAHRGTRTEVDPDRPVEVPAGELALLDRRR